VDLVRALVVQHGLSTEQVLVSKYVGCSKNLKDLKEREQNAFSAVLSTEGRVVGLWGEIRT